MNVMEMGRVVWNKANWTVNDGPTRQNVQFRGDGRTFLVTDHQDIELGTLTLAPDAEGNYTVERLDGRTVRLIGEDGTSWLIRRLGCNCGGG